MIFIDGKPVALTGKTNLAMHSVLQAMRDGREVVITSMEVSPNTIQKVVDSCAKGNSR